MEEMYLVTVTVEGLTFPIGHFSLDTALRIRREMRDTYRSAGHRTDVRIKAWNSVVFEVADGEPFGRRFADQGEFLLG
ncbi:hypothetical protein [Indiicoccus explosivorum]|uniref:hypothetical protein n=1 Tax=Indiicoccus explosivorum TaxID=1917864 RepID=UPI000B43EF6F|nr:hypothetical protein [Indiicoccus explosivorum]